MRPVSIVDQAAQAQPHSPFSNVMRERQDCGGALMSVEERPGVITARFGDAVQGVAAFPLGNLVLDFSA